MLKDTSADKFVDTESIAGSEEQRAILREKISKKSIAKIVLVTGTSMASSRIVASIGNYASIAFLSRLGSNYLASSGLIMSCQTLLIGSSTGLLYSVMIKTAGLMASDDKERVGALLQNGWALSLAMTLPVGTLMIFSKPILELLGQQSEYAEITQSYFRAYALGLPANMLLITNQMTSVGLGYPSTVLTTTLITNVILVALAYPLINKFDEQGLGLASSIAMWTTLGISLPYIKLISKSAGVNQLFKYNFHKNLRYIVDLIRLGSPIAISIICELLSTTIATLIAGLANDDDLAAAEINLQYLMLAIVPVFGLTQGAASIIRGYIGKENYPAARFAGNFAIASSTLFSIAVASCLVAFPTWLAEPFIDNDEDANEILSITKTLFYINAPGIVFDGIRTTAGGLRGGYEDTLIPMLINVLVMLILFTPTAYALALPLGLGAAGVFGARTAALFFAALIHTPRWLVTSSPKLIEESSVFNDASHQKFSLLSGLKKLCCVKNPLAKKTIKLSENRNFLFNRNTPSYTAERGSLNAEYPTGHELFP